MRAAFIMFIRIGMRLLRSDLDVLSLLFVVLEAFFLLDFFGRRIVSIAFRIAASMSFNVSFRFFCLFFF